MPYDVRYHMKPTRGGTLSILNETFRGYRRHFTVLVFLGMVSAMFDGISRASL